MRAKGVPGLRSAYDKIRIRKSIEYPVAGVAVALRREGDTLADLRVAITGTNPRPVLLEGTRDLCGGKLDERVVKGLDDLVRDQIMSMKTTFTPGHYRRRVAGVLARRLVQRLFAAPGVPSWWNRAQAQPVLSLSKEAERNVVARQAHHWGGATAAGEALALQRLGVWAGEEIAARPERNYIRPCHCAVVRDHIIRSARPI